MSGPKEEPRKSDVILRHACVVLGVFTALTRQVRTVGHFDSRSQRFKGKRWSRSPAGVKDNNVGPLIFDICPNEAVIIVVFYIFVPFFKIEARKQCHSCSIERHKQVAFCGLARLAVDSAHRWTC